MAISHSDNRLDDTRILIKKIISQSQIPLSLEDIHKLLPTLYQPDRQTLSLLMENLVKDDIIYQWPSKSRNRNPRFWNQNLPAFIRKKIVFSMAESCLTQNQLLKTISKTLFKCSQSASEKCIKQALNDLLAEKRVFEHPPVGRYRKTRFGNQPIAIEKYLDRLLGEMDRVCHILRKVGVTPDQIVEAFHKKMEVPKNVSVPPQSVPLPLPESPAPNASDQLLQKMVEIEPGALNQIPIWIPDLRKAMRMTKPEFDQAVLTLVGEGKIFLDKHAHPAQLSPSEREQMVSDHTDDYYVVAVIRKGVLNG
ncbi:MAG: hypothetical protein WA151_04465 [Desulfatirhabdiaceae bacterium]